MKKLLVVTCVLLGFTCAANAAGQAPVAIVEDLQGKVTGAELMDYVVPGQTIKLGANSSITIGYMKSCWRETVTGVGTVIIGVDESSLHPVEFKGNKVPCDSSQADRVGKENSESAATIVRSIDPPKGPPPLVLHGLSPIVATTLHGKLVVQRMGSESERYEVDLTKTKPVRGKFYDLSKNDIVLKPGTYSATLNAKTVSFVVDNDATPGAGPVIGRLVILR